MEEPVCEIVSDLLKDQPVGPLDVGGERLQRLLSMLEFFVPSFLQETDQYWKYDAFDDVLPTTIEKTGERNLELRGKGLLFSTYRYVPLNFYVELIADKTRIAVCECQGGYSREHGGRRFHALYEAVNDPT